MPHCHYLLICLNMDIENVYALIYYIYAVYMLHGECFLYVPQQYFVM
jgi:hypothetical protein